MIFKPDEIYRLVAAQYTAINSDFDILDWSDFISDEEYEYIVCSLGDNINEFIGLLDIAARKTSDLFTELETISPDYYDYEEEYFEERKFIQDEIIEIATDILSEYCL